MYHVYLLRCADTTLYCGITNDIEKRFSDHNRGRGARYTRGRLPVRIVYRERVESKREALQRECSIKKMRKAEKERLARTQHEEERPQKNRHRPE